MADVNVDINLFVGTKIQGLKVIKRLQTNKLALIVCKDFDLHRVMRRDISTRMKLMKQSSLLRILRHFYVY